MARALDAPTDHAMPADAYWRRLRPHLGRFGITRVADITGLDHLGYPVAQAVRPLARSNAVTQGKAATLAAAAVGAVLECLEMAAGEAPGRFAPVPPRDLDLWRPLAPGATWPDARTPFVAAWSLSEDCPGAVPLDVISTDFAQGAEAERAPILRNSVGLGAGASLAAAAIHGLLEAIECDARLRAAHHLAPDAMRLDPQNPTYGGILARIATAGLRARVEPLSRDGVPVVQASVMEAPGATALPLPAVGFAARFDPAQAIAAALAEALQARLAVISGAREDITQRFYTHNVSPDDLGAAWHRHGPTGAFVQPPPPVPPLSLRALAQSVGPVFAVPLFYDPGLPLAVLRIVAPGLIADPWRLERGQ